MSLSDAEPDPVGTIMAVTPPVFALLGLLIPVIEVPAQIVIWLIVTLLIVYDGRRWPGLAWPFWLAASVCVWPLALLGYAFDRRAKGGPGNVSLVVMGLVVWGATWFI
ncbi:MAG: hypothetical protein AB7K71_32055 [Polyangiaceae bacterium]